MKKYLNDKGLFYELAVPGFSQSDLNIVFMNGIFTVTGERTCGDGSIDKVSYNINTEDEESRIVASVGNGLLTLQVIRSNV